MVPQTATRAAKPSHAREILRLAVPAFGALIAEPLFLLTDSAIVGHLGVGQLAGVGLASTLLQTAVAVMNFLAYSTTPAVARAIGGGNPAKALEAGRDAVWLSLLLGIALAVAGFFAAGPLVDMFGAGTELRGFAIDYFVWSLPGLVAMLLIFAGTGMLRGFQDTRTPLVVATAGFAVNIVLNWILVYGLNMSVVGSALGTSIAQWAMAAVYLTMVARNARHQGVSLRPHWHGVRTAASVGSWILLRTLCLRMSILATVFVATAQGPINLAAHQLAMTVFYFMAFALDALAIAAQALIGKALGAAHPVEARVLTRIMIRWSLGFGVMTGVALGVAAPWAGALFTTDGAVQFVLTGALWVLAAGQPLAGFVFVLDGVLMGAGDTRYLAIASLITLTCYLPLLMIVQLAHPEGAAGLLWLWVVFTFGFMLARGITMGLRLRSDKWMVLG